MNPQPAATWIAFAQGKRIALGAPTEVAAVMKRFVDAHREVPALALDAISSHPIELDLRGSIATVLKRLPRQVTDAHVGEQIPGVSAQRGPGRPKLGVVAREVTLLPRHWDWLASQPGGASVALRKLVEHARRASAESDRQREATASAYRFMNMLAGNEPGFEEASRALFAGDLARLRSEAAKWPVDVRMHLLELVRRAGPEGTADTITTAA